MLPRSTRTMCMSVHRMTVLARKYYADEEVVQAICSLVSLVTTGEAHSAEFTLANVMQAMRNLDTRNARHGFRRWLGWTNTGGQPHQQCVHNLAASLPLPRVTIDSCSDDSPMDRDFTPEVEKVTCKISRVCTTDESCESRGFRICIALQKASAGFLTVVMNNKCFDQTVFCQPADAISLHYHAIASTTRHG